jgi:hypothetical protein
MMLVCTEETLYFYHFKDLCNALYIFIKQTLKMSVYLLIRNVYSELSIEIL